MKTSKPVLIIFSAYFFSLLGDSLFKIAFPLFIYTLTKNAFYTSLAYATQFLPYVLVMPFMGGLVDRLSKKRLLLGTDALSALGMVLLALYGFLVIKLHITVLPLFVFLFFVVTLDTVNHPAFHAFVPRLVSADLLPKINSGMGIMSNVLVVLGALLGGAMVGLVGAIPVFWINAFSFVLSFVLILQLPKDINNKKDTSNKKDAEPEKSNNLASQKKNIAIVADFRASVRYTFSDPIARFLTIFHFFCNVVLSLIQGGKIYYLVDILGLSGAGVGFVIGITGLGSVLGSFIAPFLMKRIKNGSLFIAVSLFMALAALSFVWAHSTVFIVFSLFMLNATTGIIIVLTFTMRQQHIPDLGKVITISRPVSFIPVPLFSMVAGYVLERYQSIVPLALAGFCVLFCSGLVGIKSNFVKITNNSNK